MDRKYQEYQREQDRLRLDKSKKQQEYNHVVAVQVKQTTEVTE